MEQEIKSCAEGLAHAKEDNLVAQLQDVDGADAGRQQGAESLGGVTEISEDVHRVRHVAFGGERV